MACVADPLDQTAGASGADSSDEPPAPQRLRVAWVAGRTTLADLERTLQPLAVGLLDELIELVALCPSHADAGALPGPPVDIVRYDLPWWRRLSKGAIEALAGDLRKRKVHLLHALDESAAEIASRLAGGAGAEHVVSVYGVGRRLPARAIRSAAATLPACESIRAELLRRRLCQGDRAIVLHPGLHLERRSTCFEDPRHSASIVAGGTLDDLPAFAAALRSFAELNQRKYDCVFFVIGSGRAEKAIRTFAEKLGLRSVLQFVDRQSPSQLARILAAADLYISPAPADSLDLCALGAMAAGVPVFAANGATGDFLDDGRTAMIFEPGDSAELTMKLVSLLDDRAAARALAENAMEALRADHSPAQMVTSLIRIYRHVLEPAMA